MSEFAKRLVRDEDGATMIEYAIMLALVGATLIASVTVLSSAVGGRLNAVAGQVNSGS